MIEPTESEDLSELERFISALTAIREEIRAVERGEQSMEGSPLRHAPHTAKFLISDWNQSYPAIQGAYLMAEQQINAPRSGEPGKYWPPVGRIDGAHGDRNLVCACPRPEELAFSGVSAS